MKQKNLYRIDLQYTKTNVKELTKNYLDENNDLDVEVLDILENLYL